MIQRYSLSWVDWELAGFPPYQWLFSPARDVRTAIAAEFPSISTRFGYTSRMKDWKPRFNYTWDWITRLVQVGIWDHPSRKPTADGKSNHLHCPTEGDLTERPVALQRVGSVPPATAGSGSNSPWKGRWGRLRAGENATVKVHLWSRLERSRGRSMVAQRREKTTALSFHLRAGGVAKS